MSPAFAVSWEPSQPHSRSSLRGSQYKKPKKRKRRDDESDESEDENALSSPNTAKEHNSRSGFAALTTEQAEQYRVAGHLADDDLPPPPFPHAPSALLSKRYESDFWKDLSALKPPLYAASASTDRVFPGSSIDGKSAMSGPRHLALLTTLLHRCLLEGDYERAGRAWDLIRKLEQKSQAVDVRAHGRWGLGAEVLLYRDAQTRAVQRDRRERSSTSEHSDNVPSAERRQPRFTAYGFRAAKEYYEQMILRHPGSRTHPNTIGAKNFYPAMFSLWIFGICESSRQSREALNDAEDGGSDDESDDESRERGQDRQEQLANIMRSELKQAAEMAARLDELLFSPPYDKHSDLLQLRGMVALWVGDLMKSAPPISDDALEANGEGITNLNIGLRTKQKDAERNEEIKKAARFFIGARENGARLWTGIAHLANQGVADHGLTSNIADSFGADTASPPQMPIAGHTESPTTDASQSAESPKFNAANMSDIEEYD